MLENPDYQRKDKKTDNSEKCSAIPKNSFPGDRSMKIHRNDVFADPRKQYVDP